MIAIAQIASSWTHPISNFNFDRKRAVTPGWTK